MFDINTLIRIVESPFLLRFYLSKKWFVVHKTLYICTMILIKILPKTAELLLQINALN
jgi:hypothetical protein